MSSRHADIGVLTSRIRVEEKLICEALARRRIAYDLLDLRRLAFDLAGDELARYGAMLDRSVSHSQSLAALRILEARGVPCVNAYRVAEVCGDKAREVPKGGRIAGGGVSLDIPAQSRHHCRQRVESESGVIGDGHVYETYSALRLVASPYA